ncbi:MAG: hypothetical protein K2L17_13040 [Muribaculaceae bacterium]|nr:hypothetical protein [Muribaculaceae bacterium]
MEIKATYKELCSYIQERFKQPVSLSFAEGGEIRVTYTKRILIKDVNISVNLSFDEVKADSVTIIYDGAGGWYSLLFEAGTIERVKSIEKCSFGRVKFIEKCNFGRVKFIEKCSYGRVNFIEKCSSICICR